MFLVKIFYYKVIVGESPMRCFFIRNYKWFFIFFPKVCQIPNIFLKTLFRLKRFLESLSSDSPKNAWSK